MGASYTVTGNGSALTEHLLQDGTPIMTTVYHLDGDALRMTHYCGARNQPRLKADHIDAADGTAEFIFVDATNLSGPDAAHVERFQMRLIDEAHVVLKFHFVAGAKHSVETITLERTRAG